MTDGTYSFSSNTSEQTALTITNTEITNIDSILLDLNALTKNVTIKVYIKADGTNYRLTDSFLWTPIDEDCVIINPIIHDSDIKITLQSIVAEGSSRSIPYSYVVEEI